MALTVGVVGAGSMGREHLTHLRTLGVRALVWNRSSDRADAVAAEFGAEPVPSFDELVRAADVIDLTTPTPTHLPFALAAFDAGRHVICEKPLARTADDADALVEAAEWAGRHLLTAHVVRYFPAYVRLKAQLDAGELGELQRLRFFRSGAFPASTWFADHAQSGGVAMDLMIHDLDQAHLLAGPVVRVEATRDEGVVAGHPFESASATLTHASGAISRVDASWGAPDARLTTEYAVVGTGGSLSHASRDEPEPAESPYLVQLREFLAAIETDAPTRVTPADAVTAVRLAADVLEAIETGRPVEFLGG